MEHTGDQRVLLKFRAGIPIRGVEIIPPSSKYWDTILLSVMVRCCPAEGEQGVSLEFSHPHQEPTFSKHHHHLTSSTEHPNRTSQVCWREQSLLRLYDGSAIAPPHG